MPAPSRISVTSTGFTSQQGQTKTTSSIAVQTGDILVARAACENNTPADSLTLSGGGLTWTLQASYNPQVGGGGTHSTAFIWTAVAASNTSITVTVSKADAVNNKAFGVVVSVNRGSSGVGNSSVTTSVGTGAPSLALTTSGANSLIDIVNVDWDVVNGGTRTWRSVNGSAATEDVYSLITNKATFYLGYHPDAGAAGAKTVGLTQPNNQTYTIAAIEILGTAGGASIVGRSPCSSPIFQSRVIQ